MLLFCYRKLSEIFGLEEAGYLPLCTSSRNDSVLKLSFLICMKAEMDNERVAFSGFLSSLCQLYGGMSVIPNVYWRRCLLRHPVHLLLLLKKLIHIKGS